MLSDNEILERAAQILKDRQTEATEELRRLQKTYDRAPLTLDHELGKPKKLNMMEALLVAALDHTRFIITMDAGCFRSGILMI